jgi:heat shock protein HslJ
MRLAILIAGAILAIGAMRGCSSTHEVKTGNPAVATTQGDSLLGTQWVLRDLAGSPALEKPQATLGFPEAGHAAGNGTCNQFNGSVSISGASIKFGPLAATRMACMENGIGDQENRYLQALGAATRYELRGEKLLIYFQGNDKPLAFSRAAGGTP